MTKRALAADARAPAPAQARREREIRELRESLALPLPTLPCRYFYDDHGSQLFDEITRLPEYYQARTEAALLAGIAGGLVAARRPREVVELGAGVVKKVQRLLDAMRQAGLLDSCVLLDVNEGVLDASSRELQAAYPGLRVRRVVGDFVRDLERLGPGRRRLVLFLAGTVGNLHPSEVPAFLGRVAGVLGPSGALLLGVDLVKDPARLEAAYNDSAGLTAEFNRHALRVVNRLFQADFEPAAFRHVAFWDARNAWIEMRLRATRACEVRVRAAGLSLRFAAGDEMRTELSCKYTRASLLALLPGTGLRLADWHTDPEELFGLALLEGTRGRPGELPG